MMLALIDGYEDNMASELKSMLCDIRSHIVKYKWIVIANIRKES